MPKPTQLVGVDACILIEAIVTPDPRHPSRILMELACTAAFRILLVAQVETEARSALRSRSREADLDRLLAQVELVRCPNATSEQLAQDLRSVWAQLHDEPDARIGVALKHCQPKPSVFVSSNTADWRPNPALQRALGGISVMRPIRFLRTIGAL